MSFFGISSWEFVFIVVFILIVFGPDKIPEIFKLLGKAAKMFRQAKSQVQEVTAQVIRTEDVEMLKSLQDPLGTQELKNTVATLIDPLKNPATGASGKEPAAAKPAASSIWSSLAAPPAPTSAAPVPPATTSAAPATPATPAPSEEKPEGSGDADPS